MKTDEISASVQPGENRREPWNCPRIGLVQALACHLCASVFICG